MPPPEGKNIMHNMEGLVHFTSRREKYYTQRKEKTTERTHVIPSDVDWVTFAFQEDTTGHGASLTPAKKNVCLFSPHGPHSSHVL
jgi:hypothetical protein